MAKTRTPGAPAAPRRREATAGRTAERYVHDQKTPMRPDVGTQAQFRKKKPPTTYRYDSSLSPALDWDGQNGARELGEWLLARIEEAARLDPPHRFDAPREFVGADGRVQVSVGSLQDALNELKRLGQPLLNWTGKAERLSFDVPALPLFIHERLSTKAIVDTLVAHRSDKQQDMFDLFGDPQHSVTDQVLRAYEHQDRWVNRLVLGDSLVVMNSLLQYEGLGGQVQMIYIDPPYGVKFGSNFQPFVRRRDVSHNDDEDLTREPEMVKAYRDTWELGLHSYLTYMRDRLLLARELLAPSGSVFVQISDENLHHLRELLDDVFGSDLRQAFERRLREAADEGLGKLRVDRRGICLKSFGTVHDFYPDDLFGCGNDANVDACFDLDVLGGLRLADPGEQQVHVRLVIVANADGFSGLFRHLRAIMRWSDPVFKFTGLHA